MSAGGNERMRQFSITMVRNTLGAGLSLLAFSTLALSCRQIIGVESDSDVAAGGARGAEAQPPPSAACQEYCDEAKRACHTDLSGNYVPGGVLYLSDEACLATCSHLPLTGANKNSVACRTQQLAYTATGEDEARYCANAGPGGNGACGSNCENYCKLFAVACKDEFQKYAISAGAPTDVDGGVTVCVNKCLGLADTGLFDSTQAGNYLGDTIQCRLVHTSAAMLDATHCAHAELKSSAKCFDDPMTIPDCQKFCHLALTECAGYPVYESDAQCQAVCHALAPGHVGDLSENTVGCRMYHAYNSLIDAKSHCPHTGPGGDGHCGAHDTGNCDSYCGLLEAACKQDFDASFDGQATCQTECLHLVGAAANSGHSTSATGNNLQCRLLNVSRALTNTTNSSKFCAAALGAAPCR